MQKLRTFIRILCKADQQQQLSPEILDEINHFTTDPTAHLSSHHDVHHDDELLSTTLQLYTTEYLSNFSNFVDLQSELKRLRESKLELITTTNTEIDGMRNTIKLLMDRIITKTGKQWDFVNSSNSSNSSNSTNSTNSINSFTKGTDSTNAMNAQHAMSRCVPFQHFRSHSMVQSNRSNASNPSNTASSLRPLLHEYSALGEDDVVNIMLMGTKCSGKTTLLRHIESLYTVLSVDKLESLKSLKSSESTKSPYLVINAIISSIYNVLAENDFFIKLTVSDSMRSGIEYFRTNHLSKFDGPFLTDAVAQQIKRIFPDSLPAQQVKDDEIVRLTFINHSYYRNMLYFYNNIERYSHSQWHHDLSVAELLLVWDRDPDSTRAITFRDIVLDTDFGSHDGVC